MDYVTIKAIQLLAVCVFYEAVGESDEGQRAVVHVILNRVYEKHMSVEDVIYYPSAFSWTLDKRKTPERAMSDDHFPGCVEQVMKALSERFEGKKLGGANHYFNPNLADPSWQHDMKLVRRIGNHAFYKG